MITCFCPQGLILSFFLEGRFSLSFSVLGLWALLLGAKWNTAFNSYCTFASSVHNS